MAKSCSRLEFSYFLIVASLMFNVMLSGYFFNASMFDGQDLLRKMKIMKLTRVPMSTIERSTRALKQLKELLNSSRGPNDEPWIWTASAEYPSVPYQVTNISLHQVPKALSNQTLLSDSVEKEIDRVCQRLKNTNTTGATIWCQLFNKTYPDTLVTTTTLLEDGSTYIITGDIDLMWLRDSR